MAALHGSVDMLDNETGIFQDEHEFESSAHEFIELNNWQEGATDKIDSEKKLIFKHYLTQSLHKLTINCVLSMLINAYKQL